MIAIRNGPLAFECTRRSRQLAAVGGRPSVRDSPDCATTEHVCRAGAEFRQHRLKGHRLAIELEAGHRIGGTRSEYAVS